MRADLTRALRAMATKKSVRVRHIGSVQEDGLTRLQAGWSLRKAIADARKARDPEALRTLEAQLTQDTDSGAWADVFTSYRTLGCHADMVRLFDAMPAELRKERMIREQLAFALNRLGQRARAQHILEELVAEVGATSEALGLLGRVHKDRWQDALTAGDAVATSRHPDEAIAVYRAGFETDRRDAYRASTW